MAGKPVVLHGLWLHATSWAAWRELFEQSGYANVRNSDRGPLLMIAATREHTVPAAVTPSAYKLYRHSTAVTDLISVDRGHSLVVDHGWKEIADTALDWLRSKGF